MLLTGSGLDVAAMAAVGAGAAVTVDPSALARVAAGAATADAAAARRPVYGRTTGVGAVRDQATDASADHGMALLRSHAAGWGEPMPPDVVRAALAVRANQLLVGMSGASPDLVTALVALAGSPETGLPVVHRHGGLGTGDLTALAEVGLALAGERPRADGTTRRDLTIGAADALPLLSSNAFSVAEAALSVARLQRLTGSASVSCALSFVALRGNPEGFSAAAAEAALFPGARAVAEQVRALVADVVAAPAHLQDFFGLRTWPQVHGPLVDTLGALGDVAAAMANAGSENPLFGRDPDGTPRVTHHGGFHTAYLAQAVDATLQAMVRSGQAVQSRVSHLLTDPGSGLPLFLADGTSGSSGLLIAEYVAASALSLIREVASAPASVHTASVSAGIEDDAGFAPQAVARLGRGVAAYRRLVAVELVCAVRAVRCRNTVPTGALRMAWEAVSVLPADVSDRDLAGDFELAEGLVAGVLGSAG